MTTLEISYSSLEPLSLIIATDLHYLAPELTDHGSFFEQFIEDGDGKSMKYSNELVDAFVNQVVEQKPDALILSGDLTFNGELLSHQALAKKLHRIRENDIPIFVIPGNHDLENPMALTFDGLKLYEKYNVLCNLSGHIHLQHIEQSPSGFIEFVTSSLITSPIQYGTLVLKDFSIDYKTVPVDVSGWAKKNGLTNPDLLNFAKYAQMFFWNTSFRKAEQELSSNINIHNKRILAEFFADINTAYFAGRTDTIDQKEELVAEWVQQSSFLSTYLESISDDGFQNHNEYSFYFGDKTE